MKTTTLLTLTTLITTTLLQQPQTKTTITTPTKTTTQETQPQTQPQTQPTQPEPQPQQEPTQTLLLIQENNPNNIILLTPTGQWIPNIKQWEIKITGGDNQQPTTTITTTQYQGHIKPTNPTTTTYQIKEIKTTTQQQIQEYIDNLQSNPTLQP